MVRSNKVDMFRGLLFILMTNTHALTLSALPKDHWLYSDWWLPNGWATLVFVVLSGYGVGLVFSARPAALRAPALRRRAGEILAVMLVSNTAFAMLRQAVTGNPAEMAQAHWWLGFLTLDTQWTISGVLLPTALVLLCGASVIRWVERAPWKVLICLLILRALTVVGRLTLTNAGYAAEWPVRFLFLEGLGGYPVLPFVLNGCFGIWLGMMRRTHVPVWQLVMGLLLVLQLGVYLSFFMPTSPYWTVYISTFGAVGKFAWMFLVTHALGLWGPAGLSAAVEMIGRFALGSFVMHRVFLQGLAMAGGMVGLHAASGEWRYTVLLAGTLLLTWGLCRVRERIDWVDAPLRRMAL